MSTCPRRPFAAVALLACTLLAACGGGGESAEARSAILITLDTTRWDAISANGVHPGVTPKLDALAEEGVLYDFAHTVAPLTLPSHASMLTGFYPPRHTIRDNGFQPLPLSASTLAEAAQEKGFQTAAFVASTVLDRAFGLDQGFDDFSAPVRRQQQTTAHFVERNGTAVVNDAVAWLAARDRDKPFFLWVHLFDPHDPYEPPAKFLNLTEKHKTYYGEVAYVDEGVGILVDAIRADGTLDQATLLVLSDHGESLMEHRETTHSHFCYQATLKVPFLLRYPDGHRAGERSNEVVSVVDVYPTLLDAMRLPSVTDHDGHSLYRKTVPEGRGAYFESYSGYISFGWSPIAGWIDDKGKYIHSSTPEFYDVIADPDEAQNLFSDREDDVLAYRRALVDLTTKEVLAGDGSARIDPSITRAIQGMGYAAMGPLPTPMPNPLKETGLPSPTAMVDTYQKCQQALALADSGRLPQAIQLFEQVLAENPRNWMALERIGLCYVNLRQPLQAIAPLEMVVREGPQRAGTYYNLAVSYYGSGEMQGNPDQMAKGVETLQHAIELDSSEPHFRQGLEVMLGGLSTAMRQAGRADEAQKYLNQLNELLRNK